MMMNLFSVFDPTSYFGFNLNWIIMFIVLLFIPSNYYLMNGNFIYFYKNFMSKMSMMLKEVSFPNYMALNFVCIMSFIYLMISNMVGLFPFIFTGTSHPMITLGIGVVMWMCSFMMGWTKNFKISLGHLVPEGSPLILSPLLVMIESISHLIRPFTLSIRLAANMMAGHLIVGLLSKISLLNLYSFILSVLFQNILMILEFGVSIIQAFVFSILLLLYFMEYY